MDCQSLVSQLKMKSEAAEQVTTISSYENDNILVKHEIDDDDQNKPFQLDGEEMELIASYDNVDNKFYLPKRIKREKDPIEVKTIPNKCYICGAILESRSNFTDHLESHKNMLPYKCAQCSTETRPIIYTTVLLLNKHFESHGFNHICPHCPLRYRSTSSLAYHIRNVHNEQKFEYRCETCAKVYTNIDVFRNHLNAHKNILAQRYNCEICQKVFRTRQVLMSHQASHNKPHKEQEIAPVCITPKKSLLRMTLEEICESFSKGKSEINSRENDSKASVKTEIDENKNQNAIIKLEQNDTEENNAEHSINHTETAGFIQELIKQEPTDVKDETFKSDDEEMYDDDNDDDKSVLSTKKTKRKDDEEMYDDDDKSVLSTKKAKRKKDPKVVKAIPNKCHICDTILESRSKFTDHLKSHKKMLPYKCAQCSTEKNPIMYTTILLVNRHFESHSFNYICPHCPLRFRESGSFTYHIQNLHNEQKLKYHCETCRKVFTNSHVFRNHMYAHKNLLAQRYKCEFCQKDFSARHVLMRHRESHTRQKIVPVVPVCTPPPKKSILRMTLEEMCKSLFSEGKN